jgi:hypothetical protein
LAKRGSAYPHKKVDMKHRKIEIVRGLWGAASVLAPRRVLALTGGDPDDQPSRVVMRVLGVRQVVQAGLSGVSPSMSVLAMGLWVDVVHASSGIGLALVRPRYARPALVDAAVAAGWASVGYRDLRGAAPDSKEARRSRLADAVLRRVPGGRCLLSAAATP